MLNKTLSPYVVYVLQLSSAFFLLLFTGEGRIRSTRTIVDKATSAQRLTSFTVRLVSSLFEKYGQRGGAVQLFILVQLLFG